MRLVHCAVLYMIFLFRVCVRLLLGRVQVLGASGRDLQTGL